jgi:hypothetical protein
MSTVMKINFEPVTDILLTHRKDVKLADTTLANPMNAVALTDGEWVTFSSATATINKVVRASSITTLSDPATTISFPVFAERGRYDVQSIGKVPIIFMGQYEFDTRIFDATTVVASGAAMSTLLQPVKVATISASVYGAGTRYFTGLVGASYNDNAPIVGYITRIPANNGGKLRFLSGWAVRNGTT